MAVVEDEFHVDAEILAEHLLATSTANPLECASVVQFYEDFLNNVASYVDYIEPCHITVTLGSSLLITSKRYKEKERSILILWNNIKQACALLPLHPRYNNVLALWFCNRIYLMNLQNQNAATFASFLNINQCPPQYPVASKYDADFAVLVRYLEELDRFVAIEGPNIENQFNKLNRIDTEIAELMEERTRITASKRIGKFFRKFLCASQSKRDAMQDLTEDRKNLTFVIWEKKHLVSNLLTLTRHAFVILGRMSTVWSRFDYYQGHSYARKFMFHLANLVNNAKNLSTPVPIPGTADIFISSSVIFQLVNSIECPPLTKAALQLIESLLCEQPSLATDWPHLGKSWKTFISDENDYEIDDWSLLKQQRLKSLNHEISGLRSNLRKAYHQLVDQQLIAEVEHTKRHFESRIRNVERVKDRLLKSNTLSSVPNYYEDNKPLEQLTGRIGIVIKPEAIEPQANFRVCENERLDLIEETPNRVYFRARNAQGAVGLVPTSAVVVEA